MNEENKKKKENDDNKPFIEFVGDYSKSKVAKQSMDMILAKLENAKKQAKKRQDLGF